MLRKRNVLLLISLASLAFLSFAGCGGDETTTTTPPSAKAPTVTTAAVSSITQTTAACGGNVTSNGGSAVTARGVCWSTSSSPTTANDTTMNGTGTGAFTSSLTGLTSNTPYYVRAYATNSVGTGYGAAVQCTTAISYGTVTDYDGNVYQTVTIGTQEWMAENLRVRHYRNGEEIPHVGGNSAWTALLSGAWCSPQGDTLLAATYGRLYNWYAVADVRGLAPAGWHVPSDAEWQTLMDFLGGESVAGGKLKETGISHWMDPNNGATNETGFSARGAGHRNWDGDYLYFHVSAWFWSSTQESDPRAWYRTLYSYYTAAGRANYDKRDGFSIRCVKD
jgi:uncharacterized protein (TIGR02145 family)